MDTNVPTYRVKNILRGIILLALVVFIGTAGYVFIEGWDFLDGLYIHRYEMDTDFDGTIDVIKDYAEEARSR